LKVELSILKARRYNSTFNMGNKLKKLTLYHMRIVARFIIQHVLNSRIRHDTKLLNQLNHRLNEIHRIQRYLIILIGWYVTTYTWENQQKVVVWLFSMIYNIIGSGHSIFGATRFPHFVYICVLESMRGDVFRLIDRVRVESSITRLC
jgi:hypothetical protein